jgi:hypothetical protein
MKQMEDTKTPTYNAPSDGVEDREEVEQLAGEAVVLKDEKLREVATGSRYPF